MEETDVYQIVENARRSGYNAYSDPLFFAWQRGDDGATKEAWLAAVEQVKLDNPYPDEPAA